MAEHQDIVLAEILLELKALRATVATVGGMIVTSIKLQEINPELPYIDNTKPNRSWNELSKLMSDVMREANEDLPQKG